MYAQPNNRDLTFVTFCWGKFNKQHVNALSAAIAANLTVPHRFVCVTDQEMHCETLPLWESTVSVPGRPDNFRRLKLFDRSMHELLGNRVVQIDLDAVILDDLTPLVTCPESFRIMEGTQQHARRANFYNGSLWVHDAGARQEIWDKLNQKSVEALSGFTIEGRQVIGSDQAWIAYCNQREAMFTEADGLYQYRSLCRREIDNARLVFFAGHHNPWDQDVKTEQPRLRAVWDCYASDRVNQWYRRDGGRCLLIGVGADLWERVAQEAEQGCDGLVTFPETALQIHTRRVDALAFNFDQAERKALALGFTEVVRCGDDYVKKTRLTRTGRDSYSKA